MLETAEMQERMRKVRVLLESRFDYLPAVKLAATAAVSGPAGSRVIPCKPCKGTGTVAFHGQVRKCANCDNTGWSKARKGDELWDDYVEAPLAEARVPRLFSGEFDRAADIRRLDAELRKLRVDELARAGIVAGEEGWQASRKRMDKQGSYQELRIQLGRLERVCPRLVWALRVMYDQEIKVVSRGASRLEPLAVAWLAVNMRTCDVPPDLLFAANRERQITVREYLAMGWKTSRIAKVLGVPQSKVKRIAKEAA